LAERLLDAEQIGCCIDIGHVGMRQASARFNRYHPGLGLGALSSGDGRLPDLAADVQDAMDGARRDVIDVIRSIGSLGKHVHFHLHDGHPLIPGLKDHFTFLRTAAHSVQLPGTAVPEHDVRDPGACSP
jgi:hypothetical protein